MEWRDHAGRSALRWEFLSDVGKLSPGTVRTVGWILSEDKESITLCSNHAEHGDPDCEPELSGVRCIIKSCITRRVTLRDPSRRK